MISDFAIWITLNLTLLPGLYQVSAVYYLVNIVAGELYQAQELVLGAEKDLLRKLSEWGVETLKSLFLNLIIFDNAVAGGRRTSRCSKLSPR